MHRALLIACASALLCTSDAREATAQDANQSDETGASVQTERRAIMYRIAATTVYRDSVLVAILDIGQDEGPFVGSQGRALSVYQNGVDDRPGADELGRAVVLAANDTLTFVGVSLTDSSSAYGRLYTGDLLELPTDIPALPYRSIFFDLSKSAIGFKDLNSEPLYERKTLFTVDGEALEDTLLARLATDVRATADQIRPMIPDNPQWDITLDEGRFAGMKMVDAMGDTDPTVVRAFLGFVRSYPGKYLGLDWKINETFATWLINAAPPGQDELRDSLLASTGSSRRAELIEQKLDDLADGVFTNAWNETAIELAEAGRITEAFALSDLVAEVAERLDDGHMRALMLFSRADIAEENDDYESSVRYYTEAVELFRGAGDSANESAAANNLGLALHRLDRYEDALAHFEGSIELKRAAAIDNPTTERLYSLAGSYYGLGNSLSSLGRLDQALAAYQQADSLYDTSGSASGANNSAQSRQKAAVIMKKLGRVAEAEQMFLSAGEQYEALGDPEGQADVLDELALMYSSQQQKQRALETYQRAFDLHLISGDVKDAGYSMSQIGQVHWQLGNYEDAISSHERAISYRLQANDRSGHAYSLLKLAGLYKDSGNPTEAIASYQKAVTVYDEIGNVSGKADVFESLGDLYKQEGDLKRAVQIHGQALDIRESIGAREGVATSLSDLADDFFELKDYTNSWAYYERSADLRRDMGDRAGLARELSNLGLLSHFHRRDYEQALEYYGEALSIATEVESTSDQAFSFSGLGRVHADAGRIDDALEAYGKALDLYSSASDKVRLLISIGDLYRARGELDAARTRFATAEQIARDANSRHDLASAMNAMGDLDRLEGDIARALSRSRESLAIFQEVDNSWGIAGARINIGNILNQMGANQLAVKEYQLADSLYRTVQADVARATPSNNIGTIYYHQGDYDRALPYFEEALRIQNEARIEDEFQVIILSNIGEAHLDAGRPDDALPWLEQALALSDRLETDRIGASVRTILGRYHTTTGDFESAESILTEALQLAEQVGETVSTIYVQTELGELYARTDRPDDAVAALSEAISTAQSVGFTRLLWQPLHRLGVVERDRGDAARAVELLAQSVDAVEDLRGKLTGGDAAAKVFSSGKRGDVYEDLIALLIERGEVEQAMAYVERSQNEELRRRLLDLDVEFTDPDQAAAYEEGKALESRLQQLQQRVAAQRVAADAGDRQDLINRLEEMVSVAESEYNRFVNTTLKRNSELSRHFSSRSDPSQFFRAKDRIPFDAAVVAYLLGEEKLYIFVATQETVTARVLDIRRDELAAMVAGLYEGVSTPPRGRTQRGAGAAGAGAGAGASGNRSAPSLDPDALQSLYRILIGPIETEVLRKRNIAFMPSGHLYLLPFQMLSRTGEMRDALVRTHSIFNVADLDVFLDEQSTDEVKIVAFGNADNSLPNAELEVNDIADLYEGAQVYVREEATEARAKETPASFNVLHLATHGTLDFTDFENSYLTLAAAPGEEEDGRLTLGEIWGLSTLQNYRLVTLSACRSALNDDFEDGWPVSPATAFFDVGVSTVVASLWEVDDTATSLLMQEFYRRLPTDGAAEALRQAQRTLMDTDGFDDPYFWAPFVVTGDWR